LGFANHHRVKARSDPEDVLYGLFSGVSIETFFELFQREVVVLRKKILQVEHGFSVSGRPRRSRPGCTWTRIMFSLSGRQGVA